MKKLLLTGFEPFLDFPINPTEMIVKELDGQKVGNYEIRGLHLPVDFEEAPKKIAEAVAEENPNAVISLGLAAGRTAITPERIAINCQDGEPDNRGVTLEDNPIEENGPDGYFSTLPIRRMVNRLKEAGYPAAVSNTAGTYLCNNVMYSVLHELKLSGKDIPAGFVHIPASHALAAASKKSMASWSDADLLKAITLIIEELD
ncbi:pyroglutamyl-peptidase I [Bacillus sp. ISL-47]|uniref:pyroglutamyl-peptidase I n=1 Tax=Bacillus sp. ISL-47 TaxID=2819130 RepID=UPI001BE891CE|nr:pyroglutamyl-peptidase I [Bacillus sp. ISL-47]MBT2690543.1 pyroglutamyl-peptidase I [Bacillus sp. ISL-47]MBT2710934.1 pyroglutamyl-peptidase I [Pseudomonas sp. ISL-84]